MVATALRARPSGPQDGSEDGAEAGPGPRHPPVGRPNHQETRLLCSFIFIVMHNFCTPFFKNYKYDKLSPWMSHMLKA